MVITFISGKVFNIEVFLSKWIRDDYNQDNQISYHSNITFRIMTNCSNNIVWLSLLILRIAGNSNKHCIRDVKQSIENNIDYYECTRNQLIIPSEHLTGTVSFSMMASSRILLLSFNKKFSSNAPLEGYLVRNSLII